MLTNAKKINHTVKCYHFMKHSTMHIFNHCRGHTQVNLTFIKHAGCCWYTSLCRHCGLRDSVIVPSQGGKHLGGSCIPQLRERERERVREKKKKEKEKRHLFSFTNQWTKPLHRPEQTQNACCSRWWKGLLKLPLFLM